MRDVTVRSAEPINRKTADEEDSDPHAIGITHTPQGTGSGITDVLFDYANQMARHLEHSVFDSVRRGDRK